MSDDHPYSHLVRQLDNKRYFSLPDLDANRLKTLPYCTRILLEAAVRTCDNFEVTTTDVERLLDWKEQNRQGNEIAFKPSRVLLQDFTGVPCLVDLAAMRDAMSALGSEPMRVNPLIPTDLVIDHSVSVDVYHNLTAREQNEAIEFDRNAERFSFLKWGQRAFQNMSVVPPGSGIVHQVNLEYLARVVFTESDTLYPDSVVGTDSHTTMIDGLGVLGWGVGGIEAEATMLGQPIYMVVPDVVGFRLTGKLPSMVTATDLVLKVAQMLREYKVVGKLVEFYGKGVAELSVADRATISNMSPEFGATAAFFPCDQKTMSYLASTGRPADKLDLMEKYLRANKLFRLYDEDDDLIVYRGKGLSLDLSTVVPALAGPKRPHDHLPVAEVKGKFREYLSNPVGFRGFGLDATVLNNECTLSYGSRDYKLSHGSVVLAAITSCTNTSNPSVMIGAGLLAKKAVEAGLKPLPFVKCSLSPGSHVVYEYLIKAGLRDSLQALNFFVTGFGCQTCIGNSGDLPDEVSKAIVLNDLVVAGVLSGNRNFEGRIHPLTRANFLASPPLVVAYALAGTVKINFEVEPIGYAEDGRAVMLAEIWPSDEEIQTLVAECVTPDLFAKVYKNILQGSDKWQATNVPDGQMYKWDAESTYVHKPPFFAGMTLEPEPVRQVELAYCLLNLGDSITTDHISPAGKIALDSTAAEYLRSRGVKPEAFNSYGSRRGNDEVMVRGTFANIRLVNRMVEKTGPHTVHVPSNKEMAIFDVAKLYLDGGHDTIILAGSEYGSGSSRDWAAKGPLLQGVRAVIAKSFERIHRSNLVGMGILPLQFINDESALTLGLTGTLERYSIDTANANVQGDVQVTVYSLDGTQVLKTFITKSRIDTAVELEYYKHGGILKYVLRKMAKGRSD